MNLQTVIIDFSNAGTRQRTGHPTSKDAASSRCAAPIHRQPLAANRRANGVATKVTVQGGFAQ
jgi:hypothetical protein